MPATGTFDDRGGRSPGGEPLRGLLWWLAGVLGAAAGLQGMLQSQITAVSFFSVPTWHAVVRWLGGSVHVADPETADVPFLGILLVLAIATAAWALVPPLAALFRRWGMTGPGNGSGRSGLHAVVSEWAVTSGVTGRWLLLVMLWEILRLAGAGCQWSWLTLLLAATPNLFVAAALAGTLAAIATRVVCAAEVLGGLSRPATASCASAEGGTPQRGGPRDAGEHVSSVSRTPRALWLACGIYFAVFAAMNWRLWVCLRIPHGDSAMYEEHLWNVLYGKGFRSYLDQGLFLGEHIQVVHLFLLPLYWLWPHHMLLELAESAALALGAVAVFRIASRGGASRDAALALGVAYLLYFPLQYLDIAVDLKTFRPISFGVPLMLFAIDQWERRRFGVAALLIVLTLSCKEDFAIVLASWGAWIALTTWRTHGRRLQAAVQEPDVSGADPVMAGAAGTVGQDAVNVARSARPSAGRWREPVAGVALAGLAAVYLVVATRVVIPWFRGGAEVHYARYFSRFGTSLTEIAWNIVTHPANVLGDVFGVTGVVYGLLILLPLGFVPLASPGRLLTGGPLFVLLCLNEIARDPRHHFHAPLLPLVFWAAAWGLARLQSVLAGGRSAGVSDAASPGVVSNSGTRRNPAALPAAGTGGSRPGRPARAAIRWATSIDDVPGLVRSPGAVFVAHLCWASALATGIFWSITPCSIAFWDPGSHWYWRRLYAADERVAEFARIFPRIPRDARVASTDYIHPRFTHHERSYDYSRYRRKVAGYRDTVPADTDYIVIDCRGPYAEIQRPEQVPELQRYPQCWNVVPEATSEYFIVLKRNWRDCPQYPPDATERGAADSGH